MHQFDAFKTDFKFIYIYRIQSLQSSRALLCIRIQSRARLLWSGTSIVSTWHKNVQIQGQALVLVQ